MPSKSWLIYGAYGYSGKLIAQEAHRQGLRPVLAGRNEAKTKALAESLSLPYEVFDLSDPDLIRKKLEGHRLVVHCAGPFSATADPMMKACLQTGCSYLDITGEIDIFCLGHSYHNQAVESGIVICPGVGFDVIPTDCLALALKEAMPDATHLALGFDSKSGFSRGTARTSVEGLGKGGRIRKDGILTKVPLAYKTRRIDFGVGEKLAMTIPWGDVATAHFTTGIDNVEVYIPASPRLVKRLRRMRMVQPFLGWGWVQNLLKRQVDKKIKGPSQQAREKAPTFVWGEVGNASGDLKTARLQTANGYEVTKFGALAIAQHLLGDCSQVGYTTPAALMGSQFASGLPGSGPVVFD